eukprot:scaffold177387_cov16-Prasinocladus_malaysianus.AAC.1
MFAVPSVVTRPILTSDICSVALFLGRCAMLGWQGSLLEYDCVSIFGRFQQQQHRHDYYHAYYAA